MSKGGGVASLVSKGDRVTSKIVYRPGNKAWMGVEESSFHLLVLIPAACKTRRGSFDFYSVMQ